MSARDCSHFRLAMASVLYHGVVICCCCCGLVGCMLARVVADGAGDLFIFPKKIAAPAMLGLLMVIDPSLTNLSLQSPQFIIIILDFIAILSPGITMFFAENIYCLVR